MWSCLISAVLVSTLAAPPLPVDAMNDDVFGGKVVSVSERKLTVSDHAGQMMQTFDIPDGTKVTLNGKAAMLMELMRGDAVTITKDGKQIKTIAAVRSIKV